MLTDALMRWAAECGSGLKRGLGLSLGRSETRSYLANLLRKHRLDPSVGDRLRSMQLAEWDALSLGRKRYVLWASMRNASSEFLQGAIDGEDARRVLDREIGKKIAWLLSRSHAGSLAATDFCFLPDHSWRRPLMLDVAMETFLPLGARYWLEAADRWVL
jgi:hypothetical protein